MTLEHKPIEMPEISTEPIENDFAGLSSELLRRSVSDYPRQQRYRTKRWAQIVEQFEQEPDDLYRAWSYISEHPLFYASRQPGSSTPHEKYLVTGRAHWEGMEVSVVQVDPKTGRISSDKSRNTQTRVWYEVFPTMWPALSNTSRAHDWKLDNGGSSWEECVVQLAREIHKLYGNDRRIFDKEWSE